MAEKEDQALPGAPQEVDGQKLKSEFWGVTRQQCRELLEKLRRDPGWSSDNNVYTMVDNFVKPWTQGTGCGYALCQNAETPKEVNVLVSHAWSENAEDFLETVCRSCSDEDGLFICALALYQCGDDAGPSIAAQVGGIVEESPFGRVLNHIFEKGQAAGAVWRWRHLLWAAIMICVALAALLYLGTTVVLGCFAGFTSCAYRRPYVGWYVAKNGITWTWEPMPGSFGLILAFCICLLVSALVTWICLKLCSPYSGRMMVVPNREADIYERLWCVFEIFLASKKGVPIMLANTFARAGLSKSREAKCKSEDDRKVITDEIVRWGHEAGGDDDEGHRQVDEAVHVTMQSIKWQGIVRTLCFAASLPPIGSVAIRFDTSHDSSVDRTRLVAIMLFLELGTLAYLAIMFVLVKNALGQPSTRLVYKYLAFIAASVIVYGGLWQVIMLEIADQRAESNALAFFGASFEALTGVTGFGVIWLLALLAGRRLTSDHFKRHACRPCSFAVIGVSAFVLAYVKASRLKEKTWDQVVPECMLATSVVLAILLTPFLCWAEAMRLGVCLKSFTSRIAASHSPKEMESVPQPTVP